MSANHWYLELDLTAQVAFRSFLSLEGKTSQSQRRRPHTPHCRAAAETRRTFSRPMGCAGSTPATKETGGSSGKSPRSRSPISSLCRAIRAVRIGGFPWGNLGSWASRFIGPSGRGDLGRGLGGAMRYWLGWRHGVSCARSCGLKGLAPGSSCTWRELSFLVPVGSDNQFKVLLSFFL